MKIIKVASCNKCPYNLKCKAWKDLSQRQRVYLTIGNDVPHDFILKTCKLEDDGKDK